MASAQMCFCAGSTEAHAKPSLWTGPSFKKNHCQQLPATLIFQLIELLYLLIPICVLIIALQILALAGPWSSEHWFSFQKMC